MLVHWASDREVDRIVIAAFLADEADQRCVSGAVVVLTDARHALAAAVLDDPDARHRIGDALADAAPHLPHERARTRLGEHDDRIVLRGPLRGTAESRHP